MKKSKTISRVSAYKRSVTHSFRTLLSISMAVIIILISFVLLVSCSANNESESSDKDTLQRYESLFNTVCFADEALELAKKSDIPVFERKGITAGREVWDEFYRTATGGSKASVLCAHYYTLEKTNMSAELYEKEKDNYPKLFFYLLEYDGTEYSIKVRESSVETIDTQDTYKYLLHYTGDTPSTALYTSYDNYVLVDDPEATWEGILAGIVSSQADAGYKHCMVYRDCFGWKEE